MLRSTALVIGTTSLLLVGLARVSEAGLLFGVDKNFSSASPDQEGYPPPLNGMSNIGSADSPEELIVGDLVKSVFVDTRDEFALGIGVNSSTRLELDENNLSPANVRALAATVFTVAGESPVPISASIQLSGTFQGDISPISTALADIQLRVYEFDPDDLISFDYEDAAVLDVFIRPVPVGDGDLRTEVRFEKYIRTSDSPFDEILGEGLWTGTETLDFDLPASGNGIFIELWGVAEIDPFFPGDSEGAGFNFLNTATLDISPPPGVTVTLATGQVFGEADNVVPEPATITVWSILGMCVVNARTRRRRRNISAA